MVLSFLMHISANFCNKVAMYYTGVASNLFFMKEGVLGLYTLKEMQGDTIFQRMGNEKTYYIFKSKRTNNWLVRFSKFHCYKGLVCD